MNVGARRALTWAFAWVLIAPVAVSSARSAVAEPGAVPTTVTTQLADTAHIGTTRPLTVHLSADGGHTPLPDQPVVAQRRVDGAWTDLFRDTTDATGTLTHDVSIRAGANVFKVRYAGDPTHAPDTSPVERVTATRIDTRLRLSAPDRVQDGAAATLPIRWVAMDGRPVSGAVRLQRRTGRSDSWSSAGNVPVRSGTARVDVRPRVDTSYRAVGSGGAWYTGDRSGGQRIDNIRPTRPVQMPANAPLPRVSTPAQPRAAQDGLAPAMTRLPNDVWRRMTGISWHRGCPVGRAGLRLVQVNYYGFDGYRHRGQMVIARHLADNVVRVFRDLYQGEYPVRRIHTAPDSPEFALTVASCPAVRFVAHRTSWRSLLPSGGTRRGWSHTGRRRRVAGEEHSHQQRLYRTHRRNIRGRDGCGCRTARDCDVWRATKIPSARSGQMVVRHG